MRKYVSNIALVRASWIALLLSAASSLVFAAQLPMLFVLTILSGLLASITLLLDRQRLRLFTEQASTDRRSTRSRDQEAHGHPAYAVDQIVSRAFKRVPQRDGSDQPARFVPLTAQPMVVERTVAVLCVGLRTTGDDAFGSRAVQQIMQVLADAQRLLPDQTGVIALQADGTIQIAFGADRDQAVAASLRHALTMAHELFQLHVDVRFGLSCGVGSCCAMPGQAPTVIGSPGADAARLFRMAASWHEYQLLCTEPVALVSQTSAMQRTPLTLSHANLPALPVYAIELIAVPIAAIA